MPIDWKTPCEAALRERDPAKIAKACNHARIRINERAVEMVKEGQPFESPERQALEQALRQLWMFEHTPGAR